MHELVIQRLVQRIVNKFLSREFQLTDCGSPSTLNPTPSQPASTSAYYDAINPKLALKPSIPPPSRVRLAPSAVLHSVSLK